MAILSMASAMMVGSGLMRTCLPPPTAGSLRIFPSGTLFFPQLTQDHHTRLKLGDQRNLSQVTSDQLQDHPPHGPYGLGHGDKHHLDGKCIDKNWADALSPFVVVSRMTAKTIIDLCIHAATLWLLLLLAFLATIPFGESPRGSNLGRITANANWHRTQAWAGALSLVLLSLVGPEVEYLLTMREVSNNGPFGTTSGAGANDDNTSGFRGGFDSYGALLGTRRSIGADDHSSCGRRRGADSDDAGVLSRQPWLLSQHFYSMVRLAAGAAVYYRFAGYFLCRVIDVMSQSSFTLSRTIHFPSETLGRDRRDRAPEVLEHAARQATALVVARSANLAQPSSVPSGKPNRGVCKGRGSPWLATTSWTLAASRSMSSTSSMMKRQMVPTWNLQTGRLALVA